MSGRHALRVRSTPAQLEIAKEAAGWLIDAVACATQDRRLIRGEPEYDEVLGEAIMGNGEIACLRALHNLTGIEL